MLLSLFDEFLLTQRHRGRRYLKCWRREQTG